MCKQATGCARTRPIPGDATVVMRRIIGAMMMTKAGLRTLLVHRGLLTVRARWVATIGVHLPRRLVRLAIDLALTAGVLCGSLSRSRCIADWR